MWRLFIFLLLLIASVYFGLQIIHHPGYVLFVFEPWMVQMPVWFALLSLLIGLGFFYLLIHGLDTLAFLWFKLKNALRLRREHRAYNKTQHGLSLLIQGRFKKAEKLLLSGINQSVTPLINYLAAAKAAHEEKAYDRRDHYLQKAYALDKEEGLAVGLIQAQFEYDQHQFEYAASTLNHLLKNAPYHVGILKLLEKIYVRLNDNHHLLSLLPSLRKAKLITRDEAKTFEKNLYGNIISSSTYLDLTACRTYFENLPRHVRKQPDIQVAYAKQALRFHDGKDEAALYLRKALDTTWQPEWAACYANLTFAKPERQLVRAGAWLKRYGQQPILLRLLGKLCIECQLWGKAKDYFEKSLAISNDPETCFEYGKLMEKLGKPEEALILYRRGLAQMETRFENKSGLT